MKKEPSAVADCHDPFTGKAVSGKKRKAHCLYIPFSIKIDLDKYQTL